MSKILSLDVGDERVGVAEANSGLKLPKPVSAFKRRGGEAEKAILDIINSENLKEIVVGLPLNEDGSEGDQCRKVRAFVKRLVNRCSVSVAFVDEYGSSEEALERSRANSIRITDKGQIDAIAAAIILERYFASKG